MKSNLNHHILNKTRDIKQILNDNSFKQKGITKHKNLN